MNAPLKVKPRHFLDLSDHDSSVLKAIIADAKRRKLARAGLSRGMPDADQPLNGKVLAMIFDKQSTRTRISFDMAARQLGGSTLMLTGNEMQLAREETIADTARVISRYVDAVMIRLLDHEWSRSWRQRHHPGDQRPDQMVSSLPGDGGCDDL